MCIAIVGFDGHYNGINQKIQIHQQDWKNKNNPKLKRSV